MRILLLSAYHAQSHRIWAEGLQDCLPDHQWTLLSLPPRFFNWRLRGNSLSWAFAQREILAQDFDLLVATSMCDLAGLRSFVPSLASMPNILYCHENQFDYPPNTRQRGQLENQMTTLYSALSADLLLFNSDYNRNSFLQGVDRLLKKMPDFSPRAEVMARLQHSQVIPVGVTGAENTPRPRAAGSRLHLLWNHRWEYDKGPEPLLELIQACDQASLALDVSIVGQQFRQQPRAFAEIRQCLQQSPSLGLKHWGYLDAEPYRQLLASADVVLSTALHDFQGLSVMEAVAAGCTPLLPRRLVYPEWFDDAALYVDKADVLTRLKQLGADKRAGGLRQYSLRAFSWTSLAPRYRHCFETLITH